MSRDGLSTEITLHIFNPYETFTPIPVEAELIDLSLKSIRLRTVNLSKAECEMLMEERTLAKIDIAAPFLPEPVTLKADIFWANFVVQGMNEPAYADLGFNLRPLSPGETKDVHRIIEYRGAAADR